MVLTGLLDYIQAAAGDNIAVEGSIPEDNTVDNIPVDIEDDYGALSFDQGDCSEEYCVERSYSGVDKGSEDSDAAVVEFA